jgi:hypothetical protein
MRKGVQGVMDHALKSAISQVHPCICVLMLLHMCPHSVMCVLICEESWIMPSNPPSLRYTPIYVSSYYYICVLVLLYQAPIYVTSYCYICVLIQSYCYIRLLSICVLILLHMCPHTAISGSYLYVSSYYYTPPYPYICAYILLYLCHHTTVCQICSSMRTNGRLILLHMCSHTRGGHTSAYADVCCRMPSYCCTHQHTLTYAAVCPHTAIYV